MPDVDFSIVHLVGVAADGTPAASGREAVAQAEVLAGGRRLLDVLAGPETETIPLGRRIDESLAAVERALDAGRRVAVLADGDPMHYGVGRRLAARLGVQRLRVHPAVSSVQLAAARLGLAQEDLRVVSLHGRRDPLPLRRAAMQGGPVLALTDPANTPPVLARDLVEHGAPAFCAVVLERLGTPEERIIPFDPHGEELPEFAQPNLAAFEFTERPPVPARPGIPDHALAREEGLMTKGPVRAAGLARLGITANDVVWDLGAGSGAVSMEAAALLPAGGVWAVEADAGRADLIRENRRRTGACLVEVVHGRAPGSLRGLPDPDKIFVGGGLSRGDELLEAAWSRLKPGGRLTAHLALLSGLERVRGFFAHRGVPVELDMVQAARGAELAGDLRLAALNPVFILTAAKPGEAP